MKNVWCYETSKCDGDFCPQDCDRCPKAELKENTQRLIDAEALLNALARSSIWGWSVEEDSVAHEWAMHIINEMPTIDAEPVVRCKDCIYNTRNTDGVAEDWCYKHGIDITYDDYCSYGEEVNDRKG